MPISCLACSQQDFELQVRIIFKIFITSLNLLMGITLQCESLLSSLLQHCVMNQSISNSLDDNIFCFCLKGT